jgi:serine/threonine-protein kinase
MFIKEDEWIKDIKFDSERDLIGKGSQAFVYSATHEMFGEKKFAFKVFNQERGKDQFSVGLFHNESRVLNCLEGEEFPDYLGHGSFESDIPGIAMSLIEAENFDRFRSEFLTKPMKGINFGIGVAQALGKVHQKGFLYRDMKPQNVLFNLLDQRVFLVDFGLSCSAKLDDEFVGIGRPIGTPLYMSPEVCKCISVDERSDIYSLGATLYHVFTGKPAFNLISPLEVMAAHSYDQVINPIKINHRLPKSVGEG